jgi:hypothetical protein
LLTHPTLDQLNRLGLQGMAKAFNDLATNDEAAGLAHADWLAWIVKPSIARTAVSARACATPACAITPYPRTSTTAPSAASTARSWPPSSRATGSTPTTTW